MVKNDRNRKSRVSRREWRGGGNPFELARLHVFPAGVKEHRRGPRLGDKGRRTTGASINFNFEQTRKEPNLPLSPWMYLRHAPTPCKTTRRVIWQGPEQQISGRPVFRSPSDTDVKPHRVVAGLSYSFSGGFSRGNRLSGTDRYRSIPSPPPPLQVDRD